MMAAAGGFVACAAAPGQTATPTALPTPANVVEHATEISPCVHFDIDALGVGLAYFVTTAGVSEHARHDWYEVREQVDGSGPWTVVGEASQDLLCSFPYAVYITVSSRPPGLYKYRFYSRQWPGGPATAFYTESDGVWIGGPTSTPTSEPGTATPTPTATLACVTQTNGIVECGDDYDNTANWELSGASAANTDNHTLYGACFYDVFTGYFVQLYRDAELTLLVAVGSAAGPSVSPLAVWQVGDSGLSGAVDLEYAGDDVFTLHLPGPTPTPPCVAQFNGIEECGDESDSVSNWELIGADGGNTDNYTLYVEVVSFGAYGTAVVLYKDAGRTQLVAAGLAETGVQPALALASYLDSGLYGRVDLHYAHDDYDIELRSPLPGFVPTGVDAMRWRRLP